MHSKEYMQAKHEFWNCVRMAPFTLFISLLLAFREWKPIMDAELANEAASPQHKAPPKS